MAYTITSESYGPRKPFITATATSTDDLAALGTDFAEGSTCIISTTTYKLDKVKGWIDPSQGGGGGGGGVLVVTLSSDDDENLTANKTAGEIYAAMSEGLVVFEYTIGSETTVEQCSSAQYVSGEGYYFYSWNLSPRLLAETADDYPSSAPLGQ